MKKFGGLPVAFKDNDPVKLKEWFEKKFEGMGLNFEEEFEKIGGKLPPKKKEK